MSDMHLKLAFVSASNDLFMEIDN